MNYEKLTAGTTKTAIDTAKPSEKGEIITYLSRMGDVLHNIEERSEIVILRLVAVHAVIDGDKTDLLLREKYLGIEADLQIISAESAHILDDDRTDLSGIYFGKHSLKSGTVEVAPGIAVIGKMLDVREAAFTGELAEILLLVQYRVRFALLLIVF